MQWQGWFSLALTLGVLATLAFTRLGSHLVLMGALIILSVSGIITAQEALAGFSNEGLLTVAAMFVVAAGVQVSGGVDLLVHHFMGHPKTIRQALARICVPVASLSGFLNNTPLVAIMMAASASFATPLGYQTNLMVQGPGNYRFSDFLKVGVPMNIIIGITSIIIIGLVYPLR